MKIGLMSASLTAEQAGSVLALCDSSAAPSVIQAAYCATVAVHVGGGGKQDVADPGPMTSDALQLVSIDVQLVRRTASEGALVDAALLSAENLQLLALLIAVMK